MNDRYSYSAPLECKICESELGDSLICWNCYDGDYYDEDEYEDRERETD